MSPENQQETKFTFFPRIHHKTLPGRKRRPATRLQLEHGHKREEEPPHGAECRGDLHAIGRISPDQ